MINYLNDLNLILNTSIFILNPLKELFDSIGFDENIYNIIESTYILLYRFFKNVFWHD